MEGGERIVLADRLRDTEAMEGAGRLSKPPQGERTDLEGVGEEDGDRVGNAHRGTQGTTGGEVVGGKGLTVKEEREGQVDGYGRAQGGWGRERGGAFVRVVMLRHVHVCGG